jgi:hypothetical protein
MRRQVVDHLAAAKHAPSVADRLEELLAGPDHWFSLLCREAAGAIGAAPARPSMP